MLLIESSDKFAMDIVNLIKHGRYQDLDKELTANPQLATAFILDRLREAMRSLLHIATDWPGHFPEVGQTIEVIINAGCPVDVRMRGPHRETALHWAASSNDIDAINALVGGGADLELDGSVTDGGTALANAVNFGQWDAAGLLIALGAIPELYQAAALGLVKELNQLLAASPAQPALDHALWMACSRGETGCSRALIEHGADINWIPDWEPASALDIAVKNGHTDLADKLRKMGARRATDSS